MPHVVETPVRPFAAAAGRQVVDDRLAELHGADDEEGRLTGIVAGFVFDRQHFVGSDHGVEVSRGHAVERHIADLSVALGSLNHDGDAVAAGVQELVGGRRLVLAGPGSPEGRDHGGHQPLVVEGEGAVVDERRDERALRQRAGGHLARSF